MIRKILKENYIDLLILLVISLLLIAIIKSFLYETIYNFDILIHQKILLIFSKQNHLFFRIMTEFGNVYIPFVIIALLIIIIKNRYYSIILFLSYSLSGVLSLVLKYIVLRPRPVDAIIDLPKTYSFPSGHAMTSLVFYLTLCYLLTIKSNKNVKFLCYVFFSLAVLLISFSRIYLGVHYFSDVISGLIIGLTLFLIIKKVINKYFKEVLV